MIYPILSVDLNNVTTMDLIDTDYDEGPFLSVTDVDAPAIFSICYQPLSINTTMDTMMLLTMGLLVTKTYLIK